MKKIIVFDYTTKHQYQVHKKTLLDIGADILNISKDTERNTVTFKFNAQPLFFCRLVDSGLFKECIEFKDI